MTIFLGFFHKKISPMKYAMRTQVSPDPKNDLLVLYRVKVRTAATAAATVAARAANQTLNSNDFLQR